MLAYVLSPILCTAVKLEILGGLLIVGIIGYGIVEYLWRRDNRRASVEMADVTGNSYEIKL